MICIVGGRSGWIELQLTDMTYFYRKQETPCQLERKFFTIIFKFKIFVHQKTNRFLNWLKYYKGSALLGGLYRYFSPGSLLFYGTNIINENVI